MIRTLSHRVFVANHPIVLVKFINCHPMSTKLQLKTIPGDYVQSQIKVFAENVAEKSTNLTNMVKRETTGDPGTLMKAAEQKMKTFLDVAKMSFFITCERAVVVAKSNEMKNALDHSLTTMQHYFFLIRRIAEEVVVIVQKITQHIREKSNHMSVDKNSKSHSS